MAGYVVLVEEEDNMHCPRCGRSLQDNWGNGLVCGKCVIDLRIKKYDAEHGL